MCPQNEVDDCGGDVAMEVMMMVVMILMMLVIERVSTFAKNQRKPEKDSELGIVNRNNGFREFEHVI